MTKSYMQMFYLTRDGHDCLQTGVGAMMETNALTWAAFKSYRTLEVSKSSARFMLDYYNAKGDLADTILLDAQGYSTIANELVLSEAAYRKIDRDYWEKAKADSQKQAA